jgi:hypothetical protein
MKIFVSFIISFVFSLFFVVLYRNKPISPSWVIVFFLLLFMSGLAAQYWVIPFGPTIYGIHWMPILTVILIITFLFASPSPQQRSSMSGEKEPVALFPVVSAFYMWMVLIILLLAVIIGIYTNPTTTHEVAKILNP